MLLLSDDPKVSKSARTEWKFNEAYDDVAKRFPAPRYVVREWGKRSMIVIDLKSGPIGSLVAQAKTVKGLVAKIPDASTTLDIGSLSPEECQALHLNVVAPPGSEPTGSIGLEADLAWIIRGRFKRAALCVCKL